MLLASVSLGSQVRFEPDGSTTLLRTTPTTFDEILDLELVVDAFGIEALVVAGVAGGQGQLQVWEDVDMGEFGRDGTIDRLAHTIDGVALRQATEIVLGPDGELLVWDLVGQRVTSLTDLTGISGSGPPDNVPDGLAATPAITIPPDRMAVGVVFAEQERLAFGALSEDDSTTQRGMVFDDTDGDGSYSFEGEGRVADFAAAPTAFGTVPTAASSSLWVQGPVGADVEVLESDIVGAEGASLGVGRISDSSSVLIDLARPLSLRETVRLRNATTGALGPFVEVRPARPQARYVLPRTIGPLGGESIRVVGSGLDLVTEVRLGGTIVSFARRDDQRLSLITPSLPEGVFPLVLVAAGQSNTVGSIQIRADAPIRFDASSDFAAWSTERWTCGTVLDGTTVPSGDDEGCEFSSRRPEGLLTSPPIPATAFGATGEIELAHRPGFVDDDGGVLQVSLDDGPWSTLVPLGGLSGRVASNRCFPSHFFPPWVCRSDSDFHGALGITDQGGWRFDRYSLPDLSGATSFRIRLAATNVARGRSSSWLVDSLSVSPSRVIRRPARTETRSSIFGPTCVAAGSSGSFECEEVSPLDDADGAVWHFTLGRGHGYRHRRGRHLHRVQGAVRFPLDLVSVVVGSSATLELRHQYDFRAEPLVARAGGDVTVCCGSTCEPIAPTLGYPGRLTHHRDAFTDQGVERIWLTDHFDVSAYIGSSCELVFEAEAPRVRRRRNRPIGWAVDELDLIVR